MTQFNGKPAMSLQLMIDEDSDITDVVAQAKTVVEQYKTSGQLPDNVSIDTWYDNSQFITE
jgi:multidrug efflux pump subunit AcrB